MSGINTREPLAINCFGTTLPLPLPDNYLYNGKCEDMLNHCIETNLKFDLIFTSPPYNLGKQYGNYNDKNSLDQYLIWQTEVISLCEKVIKSTGSICWQVGNSMRDGHIEPLDIYLVPIFNKLGFILRNRIIWHYGHGLHCKHRFSGRYETILWFTKSETYKFNIDPIRIPSKYPGKRHFKGPKKGELSGNPNGKNPEDVWFIPNIKHNHIEKTKHPCQFPVALVQRMLLATTNIGDTIFDPFAGACTTMATAAQFQRRAYGSEINPYYCEIGKNRIQQGTIGNLSYRDHLLPIL